MSARFRLATLLAVALLVGGTAATARGSQWMFEPSYFSEGVPPHLAEHIPSLAGRTAYRRPYANVAAGGSVRGGFRWNRVNLRSGTSNDTILIREHWHQFQPAP